MSRYERLEVMATALARRFNRIETLAEAVALTIAMRLREYLGAPPDAIKVVEVDASLHPKRILGAGERPSVQHGPDGNWYFGLQITYGSPERSSDWLSETMVLCLTVDDPEATGYELGLADEPLMHIARVEDLDLFFDQIVRSTEQRLDNNFRARPRFIGFAETNGNT